MNQISVIIVSWNARNHLRNCLDSLRKTGAGMVHEVIVVDNASRDGSPEMVEADYPEVILIRSAENLGFAKANNVGIRRATGSMLALVNSDVIVHADCLQRLAALLDSDPGIGLAGPKIIGGDGKLQCTCRQLPTVWNTGCRNLALDRVLSRWKFFAGYQMRHWNYDTRAEVEVISGCFWLARRTAVDQVGGLDERFFFYAEDVDWCKRFRDAGWRIVFSPEATATHFGGGSSSNAPLRYNIEMLRANLLYWNKHHGSIGKLIFYLMAVLQHFGRLVIRAALRITGGGRSQEASHKLREHVVCLRWLLTGKGV